MERNTLLTAVEHHRAGRLAEAEAIYRGILAKDPNDADALNLLGVIARQTGHLQEAIDLIGRAVILKPDSVDAHGNLGNALKDAGQLDAAVSSYRRAIEIKPDYAKAHLSLGEILASQGRASEAIESFRRAIQIAPDLADAHYGLGHALFRKGELGSAADCYRRVVGLQPENADAHNNLGIALKGLGRIDEAIESFERAIQLNANRAEIYYNLGNAQRIAARLDEAAAAYQRAIELKPDYADARNNLGLVMAEQGRLDETIANCRLAIKLKPATSDGFINLLYALYHHPDYDSRRILEESQAWARRQVSDPADYSPPIDSTARRRLKIGYLSPFFGMCADAHFILPLLANHDRQQFEIFCYSRSAGEDGLTGRLRPMCDHWFDIRGRATREAVELIRGHQLDVLVVMSRPADECQTIMAQRMAPIQMTWLTFASATTGLKTVDYRISDPFLDLVGADESVYAEKTVRLPETAWCYDPLVDSPEMKTLPALANGYMTFGSLNRLSKINRPVVATWAKVLASVPGSRMNLLANPGSHRQRLLDEFADAGIDARQIEFIERQSRVEYLKQYDRIDLTLDTFPFGGHTTTLDSLWMGAPVVTLAGRTSVGRASSSALHNLGLAELVGRTAEEFVSIAVQLAGDLPKLAEIRKGLRQKMRGSALTDGPRFARNMEQIYRQLRQDSSKV